MFRIVGTTAHGIPLLFNVGFLTVVLLLLVARNALVSLASASSRAFTCMSGYLRPSPDPWLEVTLREAFAEFDRDLAAILRHEQAPR
jgi:hypothetical protein